MAQGGDPRVVDDYTILPTAQKLLAVKAPAGAAGFVSEVDALKCGHAIMALGGGRATITDRVGPCRRHRRPDQDREPVNAGTRLCTLHINDDAKVPRPRR